jgi:hypothetical protein
MKRISSKMTLFYKIGVPLIWFGVPVIATATLLFGDTAEKEYTFLIGPCVFLVLGFFLLRKLVWNLADEVLDGGDYLLVKSRGYEERVALSNIMNVNASTYVNPPRITLKLVTPAAFGGEVAFVPRTSFTLNPFAKNPVAEDLVLRAYHARTRNAP